MLKEACNDNNQKYKIRDQLPARHEATESRNRDLLWQNNKKKNTADHLQMSINRNQLMINNTTYKKLIELPSARSVLLADPSERIRWNKVRIIPGNVILKGKCRFHGFSVVAGKAETIRDAYNKLRFDHADARHIVCCYRLPGKCFPVLSDFVEDQEHGMGQTLLRMLSEAQIYNRAIFVIRYYGGEHLGPACYQAYLDAAQSAVIHDPYNYICKTNQTPWPKEPGTSEPTISEASQAKAKSSTTTQMQDHHQTLANLTPGGTITLAPEPGLNQIADTPLLASAPEPMAMSSAAREGSPVQDPPANSDYQDMRGRLPSGPLKPLSYLHGRHYSTEPEWENYYQNQSYQLGHRNWSDGEIPELTANMSEMTQSLSVANS